MRIDILTLFPNICQGALGESMMKRAQKKNLAELRVHDLRAWAHDKHHVTDDAPYGGGPGMVMKCAPVFAAVEELRGPASRVLLMSPGGQKFAQKMAEDLSRAPHLILLCGHYEGVDQRIIDHLIDAEISIGDYVLTNGALAALVVADAVVRLIPGVLGDAQSAADESFSAGLLEGPHYTRPTEFREWRVPDVLLSGNHREIARWRAEQARAKTARVRPDLLGGKTD